MYTKPFTFANDRLEAFGTSSSKKSIIVNIKTGEFTGTGFISVDNFLYLLQNPSAEYQVQKVDAHLCLKMGREIEYPTTLWVAPYKPCRL